MDMWKFFDITHRHHRFCNPISVEKLDELCALAGRQAVPLLFGIMDTVR